MYHVAAHLHWNRRLHALQRRQRSNLISLWSSNQDSSSDGGSVRGEDEADLNRRGVKGVPNLESK